MIARVMLAAAAAAGLTGCGRGDMCTVVGSVTLDGRPLKEGTVRFEPVADDGPTAGALIEDGHFRTEVYRGKNKVRFDAWVVIPPKRAGDDPVSESILPKRYHEQSELTLNATPGTTVVNYDLLTQ